MAPKRTGYGTWQVRWRDPTGKQRAKSFDRKVDAETFERETLVDQRRGAWVDPDLGRITVGDLSERWLAAAHHHRPRTVRRYRQELSAHIVPALGHLRIDRVTATHIDDFLRSKQGVLAPAYVRALYGTLRTMFNHAVARDRLVVSPVSKVEAPRVPREEMRFLRAVELETLADAPTIGRWHTWVLVAGWGGLRWGELAGLRVGKVDVAGCRVRVVAQYDSILRRTDEPKSKAGFRWVTVPASVMADLADHIDGKGPDEHVWTMPRGGPLHYSHFSNRVFHPAAVEAGLASIRTDSDGVIRYTGITPHDLRHTSVALAIAEGAHPKAIQARMGHSSISVTLDRYGHLFPEMDATIAGKLDHARSEALTERRRLRAV